jgi:hypothetical protein
MVLEEINGSVVCTIMREGGGQAELAVGDYFSDHESSTLTVIGTGVVIVRVDPNCTFEVRGVEPVVEEETPPAPVVQIAVTDTVTTTEEPPVIIYPEKTAE